MKKRHKLSLRIAIYLIAAQLTAFLIGWIVANALGLYGTNDFSTSFDEMTYARMRALLISSLTQDDGLLRIATTPALSAELARTPGLQVAAYDPETWRALPGSSATLVSALGDLTKVRPNWLSFALEKRQNLRPGGFLQIMNTGYGPIAIAVYGARFRATDLIENFVLDFRWLGVYFIPVSLASAGIAWFAIRKGLAPLRVLADKASRIDMRSLNQRLPETDVPDEIGPLVDSMNEALERLDDGAARLKRFIANAAHELRTPVAILTARLEAPKRATFAIDLQRDVQRIRNLVEQLLASVQLSSSEAVQLIEIDLVEASRAIVADALLLAVQSNRDIEFQALHSPVVVNGVPYALHSILSNLIENALRAEPEQGTIIVRVNSNATIEVVDHGPGISKADCEMLFEPFWRKHSEGQGLGLGLAIAADLMSNLNGAIEVTETLGGGATFRLSFSRADAA